MAWDILLTSHFCSRLGVRTDPVDLPWSNDRQEQHSLQFFVQHSAPQLAGYFDSPFWQRMVLQAGRHEPAVRHAIAAIGALHEKLLAGSVSPDQSQDRKTQFALEQCNKSIQHLVKPPNPQTKPDLRLMLTTCVLFTCFEALQGHCEQAIIHATQGYTLLQQYAMVSQSCSYLHVPRNISLGARSLTVLFLLGPREQAMGRWCVCR